MISLNMKNFNCYVAIKVSKHCTLTIKESEKKQFVFILKYLITSILNCFACSHDVLMAIITTFFSFDRQKRYFSNYSLKLRLVCFEKVKSQFTNLQVVCFIDISESIHQKLFLKFIILKTTHKSFFIIQLHKHYFINV